MKPRNPDVRAFLERFREAVRAARNARGLSQEDLDFDADLDRTYVSDAERGVRNPTVVTVFSLAKALKLRPSKLVTGAKG